MNSLRRPPVLNRFAIAMALVLNGFDESRKFKSVFPRVMRYDVRLAAIRLITSTTVGAWPTSRVMTPPSHNFAV